MPPLYDEAGNEVKDVVAKADVDQLTKEAADKAREEAERPLKDTLAQKEAELAKLREQERNWKGLREGKDKAEEVSKRLDEVVKTTTEQVDALKRGRVEEIRDETIKKLAADDEEAKKIRFHYDKSLTGEESTREAIEARVRNAYLLAMQKSPEGVLTGQAVSSGGAGTPRATGAVDPETREFAGRFGLSEDDLKKYNKPQP